MIYHYTRAQPYKEPCLRVQGVGYGTVVALFYPVGFDHALQHVENDLLILFIMIVSASQAQKLKNLESHKCFRRSNPHQMSCGAWFGIMKHLIILYKSLKIGLSEYYCTPVLQGAPCEQLQN